MINMIIKNKSEKHKLKIDLKQYNNNGKIVKPKLYIGRRNRYIEEAINNEIIRQNTSKWKGKDHHYQIIKSLPIRTKLIH